MSSVGTPAALDPSTKPATVKPATTPATVKPATTPATVKPATTQGTRTTLSPVYEAELAIRIQDMRCIVEDPPEIQRMMSFPARLNTSSTNIRASTAMQYDYKAIQMDLKKPKPSHQDKDKKSTRRGRPFDVMYPLAFPKNRQLTCEMCDRPATRCCRKCQVTYYCSADHFDYDENHPSVCDLIKFVRSSRPFSLEKQERDRMDELVRVKKRNLVDKIIWVGIKYMLRESYEQASLAFYQATNYSQGVLNDIPIGLAKVYLYRTECLVKLGQLDRANFNLGLAEHCLLTYEEIQNDTEYLVSFYQTQGLLHMAQEEWDDALYSMAESIYHQSTIDGPNSRGTARSYFHMGEIYENIGQKQIGKEYYAHALQNYISWFLDVYKENFVDAKDNPGPNAENTIKVVSLPVFMEGDALLRLKRLVIIFGKPKGVEYGLAVTCLGFLTFFKGLYKICKLLLKSSFDYAHMMPNSPSIVTMFQYAKDMHRRMIENYEMKKH